MASLFVGTSERDSAALRRRAWAARQGSSTKGYARFSKGEALVEGGVISLNVFGIGGCV